MATVWISVQEAARRLRTTHVTVHNWIATGKLRGKRLPPLDFWVVDARGVARLAKERPVPAAHPLVALDAVPVESIPAAIAHLTARLLAAPPRKNRPTGRSRGTSVPRSCVSP